MMAIDYHYYYYCSYVELYYEWSYSQINMIHSNHKLHISTVRRQKYPPPLRTYAEHFSGRQNNSPTKIHILITGNYAFVI